MAIRSGVDTPLESNLNSRMCALVLAIALLGSGFSGLTNEVIWQRSLKRFLGGSETLSTTLVMLVFLLGLGFGAVWMGARARRMKDPLVGLIGVECALLVVNWVIAEVFRTDVPEVLWVAQSLALELRLPLPIFYLLGSGLLLVIPCFLMGATVPLASEICQRRLAWTDPRVLGLVFFVNTLGATAGCVLGSTFLIPEWGMYRSLLMALSFNGLAAVLLGCLRLVLGPAEPIETVVASRPKTKRNWYPSIHDQLAFGLGACALAYELVLLRICVLVHEPQPATFAMVLTGYLLFWSVGAALASRRIPMPIVLGLVLTAGFAAIGLWAAFQIPQRELGSTMDLLAFIVQQPSLYLPCLLFGFLFTRVTAAAADSWGRDVGRVYGWNTLGAAVGILVTVYVGYAFHLVWAAFLLCLSILVLAARAADEQWAFNRPRFSGVAILSLLICTFLPKWTEINEWGLGHQIDPDGGTQFYFGPSGVVGVGEDGSVYWDGLWHSELLNEPGQQIDTNNWWMAVAPVLAHSNGDIRHVALLGLGTGMTAGTLAMLDSVERIDAFEINHTLEQVFADYPEGTMNVSENAKIHIRWQDARTGLTLTDQRYDIITTAPLYLRQAGSGILNSRETFELIRSRLAPGGVACVFAWGTDAQAYVVRQTAAEVFDYQLSLWGGYLLLLSDSPLVLNEDSLTTSFEKWEADPLWQQIEGFAGVLGAKGLATVVDEPSFDWGDGRWVTTDDHPILEYPDYLERHFDDHIRVGGRLELPAPGLWSHEYEEAKWLGRSRGG